MSYCLINIYGFKYLKGDLEQHKKTAHYHRKIPYLHLKSEKEFDKTQNNKIPHSSTKFFYNSSLNESFQHQFKRNTENTSRTHKNSDNSIPCNLCSYKAYNENDLRRHKNVMHGEPLICYKCKSTFMIRAELLSHIKKYHRSSPK